jgi:HD-GYP domain-containing protein (c-di-GMP phosphodiesterase class II)
MRPLSNLTRRTALTALDRASADAQSMPGNLLQQERLDELTAAARRIVDEVRRLPEAPYDLTGPVDHPIDATVVGVLVGRRLDLPGDALEQLGLGIFLQDIGMLALPPSIVQKDDALDEAERELMRRHPLHGLELLRHEDIGPEARGVVRYHHERWDGAGYPSGLAGGEIPPFARIAALAGAFTAGSSQRASVDVLRAGAGSAFDPELVEVFADVALARSPGLRTDSSVAAA